MSGALAADARPEEQLGTVVRAVAVVVVAFVAAFAVAGVGARLLVDAGFQREGLPLRVGVTALQFVGFGLGVASYLALTDSWSLLRIRSPTLVDAAWIGGGFLTLLAASLAVGQLLSALGIEVAQNQVIAVGRENPEFFLYMIPVSLLLVGPFEELVFRGTVQELLRRAWSGPAAIVLASAMFGIVHWVALTGGGSRASYIAIAATLGLVLGYVYERTRNLLVPAAVHGGYNAVLFAVQYAVATGLVQ